MIKPASAILADPDYPHLKSRILAATGLAYFTDKDDSLAERLQRRMAAIGTGDCRTYRTMLEAESFRGAEMDALAEQLTIGETFFFRYAQQFQVLRDRLIPEVIARNAATRRLRIWSAGCSTGAEAYSVAALVHQALGVRLPGWRVSILGTDINQAFLAQARTALFGEWAMRDVSEADRAATVEPAAGGWRVRPELRAMVEFRRHNLMDLEEEPPSGDALSGFDIILCRNVMIYFDRPALETLVPRLASRLVEQGWLLVGHAETGDVFHPAFETVLAPGTTLYRRRKPAVAVAQSRSVAAKGAWPMRAPRFPSEPPLRRMRPRAPARPAELAASAAAAPGLGPGRGHLDDVAQYRAQVAATPTDPLAHYFLALALDQNDTVAEAEQALRRALYLDRGFAMAHFQLGTILRRRGELEAALKAFANALRNVAALGEDVLVPATELNAAEMRALLLGQMRSVRPG